MTPEVVERLVAGLVIAFPGTRTARDDVRTLVRIPFVCFPEGCEPEGTEALVVFSPGAPLPELFLKCIPARPDGGVPRSTATTMVGGESWCTFSFNLTWDHTRHSAEQFVLGRLRRFALNE
jgi:hypothetical protein